MGWENREAGKSALGRKKVGLFTFSPDGEYLMTGERESAGAKASLWKVPSGKLVRTFEGHKYWVSHTVFSPDGTVFTTTSTDNNVKLWKPADKS